MTIAPKLACADCGQIETECRLEITEQGKTLCCDCLYNEKHPDATCYRCGIELYSRGIVLCGGGDECETWYCAACHADGTDDCPLCCDWVDQRDAPNVRPYKKCCVCGDRKSCGNYQENDWFCEDCG